MAPRPTDPTRRPSGTSELTIATSCPACDRPIEVALELRPSGDRLKPVTICCPYCRKAAQIDSGRRVLWVATADDEDPGPGLSD